VSSLFFMEFDVSRLSREDAYWNSIGKARPDERRESYSETTEKTDAGAQGRLFRRLTSFPAAHLHASAKEVRSLVFWA
jgi:hypothetical protein